MINYHFRENNLNFDEIYHNQHGKPLHEKINFNISHSDEFVVGLFENGPLSSTRIGLDIIDKNRITSNSDLNRKYSSILS